MDEFWWETIRDLSVTIAGTIIGVWGAIHIFKREEKSNDSKDHLLRIRKNILAPWLDKVNLDKEKESSINFMPIGSEIYINEDYKAINKELFYDTLNNHFPKLKLIKSFIEKVESDVDKEIEKIIKGLNKEFKGKEFDKEALKRFFNLGQDTYPNLNIHIDYDHLMYGSRIITHSDEETSKKIKLKLEDLYRSRIGKKMKKLYIELKELRESLIKEIDKSIAMEKLPGRCNLLK